METLRMLVPPAQKFMEEVNDPLANDANETVAQETIDVREKTVDGELNAHD